MAGRGDRVLGRLALLGGALAVLAGLLALVAWDGAEGTVLIGAVTAISYGLAGGLLARARPRNPLGWLLLLVGVLDGAGSSLAAWAGSAAAVDAPGRTAAAWLASWVWFPALALLPTVLLLLYPTGSAGSRPRRWLVAAASVGMTGVAAALALSPEGIGDIAPGLDNPVAVEPVSAVAAVVGFCLLVPTVLAALVDAVRRLWRAGSPEREQLAWFLLTVVVLVAGSYTPWVGLRAVVQAVVPAAIAVGVVRHRLLDLQVVVRRTLLFAALTGLVIAVFALSTVVLSGAVGGGTLPVAVTAALVAVGLNPAREVLQRAVDRVVYGDRSNPMRAVASVGRDVAEHDDDVLVPQVLRTVAAAVRSPHVVLLDADDRPVAEAGSAADGEPVRLPLQVGGRLVGTLAVAPRTPRDRWSSEDRVLLDVLARQVAVVAHADRLNAELSGSRDRVLEATAEERRRLHEELHDGLGPALSGIALGLEAAEVALERSPERAAALLRRLREETQGTSREVRRLVEGLRPAALDRQELDAALTRFVDGLRDAAAGRLEVALQLPDALPPLPPDVDAAAYRIVTEALTNVVRHSGARTARVAVTADDGGLRLVVEDDGAGLPRQPRDGVGLTSMRRRASGLGGTWAAGPRPGGGTRIEVLLPSGRPAGVPA